MTVNEVARNMIRFSQGNRHDINHLLKVHAYARIIGLGEGLDEDTQRTLEIAALLHDIACPLCREKYGHTAGPLQEREGMPLVRAFFQDTDLEPETLERVVYLVGHHHTISAIDGIDYQILIEADYLVNADESGYPESNLRNMLEKVFKTATGKELLREIYCITD